MAVCPVHGTNNLLDTQGQDMGDTMGAHNSCSRQYVPQKIDQRVVEAQHEGLYTTKGGAQWAAMLAPMSRNKTNSRRSELRAVHIQSDVKGGHKAQPVQPRMRR